MPLRPTQNINICNLSDLATTPQLFETQEICVDIGGGNVVAARRYVLRDPATLAPVSTRIEDAAGAQMIAGTIVECDCSDVIGTLPNPIDTCAEISGFPQGATLAGTTMLIAGDCQKYSGQQVSEFVGAQLVTDAAFMSAVLASVDFSAMDAAQVTALTQMIDFSQLTPAQVTAICDQITAGCDVATSFDLVGNILTLRNGQGDPLAQEDLSALAAPATTHTLTFSNGELTSVVNGVQQVLNLRGSMLQSLGGVNLGYLLPLA